MTIVSLPWWANQNTETVDRSRVLKLRFSRLGVGDSLYCPKTGWRVVCFYKGSSVSQYAVYKGDDLVFPSDKNCTSEREKVLQFLLESEAPTTMEYVHDGAFDFLKVSKRNKPMVIKDKKSNP